VKYQPISTAPRDGTPVRIRGTRFMSDRRYTAVAIYAARRCPSHEATGWFPATDKHDGAGPYGDVTHWKPLA
jgi:hypothetical protein